MRKAIKVPASLCSLNSIEKTQNQGIYRIFAVTEEWQYYFEKRLFKPKGQLLRFLTVKRLMVV